MVSLRRAVTWRDGVCAGVLLTALVSTHWLTVNLSPSVPVGVYRYTRTDEPFARGTILRVPAVVFGRSWWASWLALLKPVAGVPGDAVCITAAGLWVRETDQSLTGEAVSRTIAYGPVYHEHKGQPLPVFWGCHVVEDGEVFVASQEPRSLDGRYFGMTVAAEAVQVVPLWIWR